MWIVAPVKNYDLANTQTVQIYPDSHMGNNITEENLWNLGMNTSNVYTGINIVISVKNTRGLLFHRVHQ